MKDDTLLNFLVEENEEDQKIKSGSGSQKSRKGYIGHIVSICRKVQEAAPKNAAVAKLVESNSIVTQENNLRILLKSLLTRSFTSTIKIWQGTQ